MPPKPARDWNSYITLMKKWGKPDQQIIFILDQVRHLFRNPITHPDEHVTKDKAAALLGLADTVLTLLTTEKEAFSFFGGTRGGTTFLSFSMTSCPHAKLSSGFFEPLDLRLVIVCGLCLLGHVASDIQLTGVRYVSRFPTIPRPSEHHASLSARSAEKRPLTRVVAAANEGNKHHLAGPGDGRRRSLLTSGPSPFASRPCAARRGYLTRPQGRGAGVSRTLHTL